MTCLRSRQTSTAPSWPVTASPAPERHWHAGDLPELPDAQRLRVGAPIARPEAVLCIGQNYAAHAAESGDAPPEIPIIFFKHPNTVVGPFDQVAIPPGAEKVDWEVELAVVIGRQARYLSSPADSLGLRRRLHH